MYSMLSDRSNRILDLVKQHEDYRGSKCINLRADENRALPAAKALLSCDMVNRNTSPDPRFAYRGTGYMVEMSAIVDEMARELFRAKHVHYSCTTGHAANILVFLALCKPGDTIMSMDPAYGGYAGTAAGKLPSFLGLNVISFPFQLDQMNIDEDASIELILREKPKLVIFGATYFLFPQPVQKIAQAVHSYGGVVAYDGAHVLGLVACGEFQAPFQEGADIIFGSTMKSFAGIPGGILATNSDAIYEKLISASDFVAVTAVQWNRIPALGITFDWLLTHGKDYATRVISNAQILARELVNNGIPIMCGDLGYTKSHTALLDLGDFARNTAGKADVFSKKFEAGNIIIDDRGRIATSEVSRIGMGNAEMVELAKLMGRAYAGENLDAVRTEVAALRARFEK